MQINEQGLYGKATESLRNRINVQLVNNKTDYVKCTLKLIYMWHKIFENKLVAIRKSLRK